MGKTRLVAEALAVQRSLGAVTEMARATRAAASVPFGALAHLLGSKDDEGGVLPADRLSVLRHLTSAVAERAGGAPLVLAVDDAHLLDAGAAAVVHHLAATASAQVLLTVRTGEVAPDPVTALWKDGLCERLDLPELGRDQVSELLTRALGGPVEPSTLARLWRITLGNTLFLHELVTEALEHGHLTDRRGVWFWTGDRQPGPRLSEVVHDRLGRLDEPALRVVRLLALGEPLTLASLVELTGPDVVARLEAEAVVCVEDGPQGLEARLGHPLYGEIVQAETPRTVAAGLVGELSGLSRDAHEAERSVRLGSRLPLRPPAPGVLVARLRAPSRTGSAVDRRGRRARPRRVDSGRAPGSCRHGHRERPGPA